MIKKIFDEIAAESSINRKVEILSKYKDNELLKRVLYLCLSKRIKWYIRQIPDFEINDEPSLGLSEALEELEAISNREITGYDAIKHLCSVLNKLSSEDAFIVCRIIDKDLKVNVGRHLVNKVWPGLIEITPYQGCKPYSPKLIKKLVENGKTAVVQEKLDGRFSNSIIREGDVELESRSGEVTYLEGAKFLKELKKFDSCVLNGELTIANTNRYQSNGIIASLVSIGDKILKGEDTFKDIKNLKEKHGYDYQEALDAIEFTCWDIISVSEYFHAYSKTLYKDRLKKLKEAILEHKCINVKIVDTWDVHSYDEIMAIFQDLLNKGCEGAVVKDVNSEWIDGKHGHSVKLKLEITVDLRIKSFNLGSGKNENVVSSITVESSDGEVITRPAGIDEATMDFITSHQEELKGRIIEVECNGLSKGKDREKYALLHPRYVKIRDDKFVADSLEDIKKIEAMAKGLV